MTDHNFQVGDRVKVTKERHGQPCSEAKRNGVIMQIADYIYVQHLDAERGTGGFRAGWDSESLELNDHRYPCACFECAS